MAGPFSLRKSASVLKSGISRPVSQIELIWLTGRLMPDFKTLADFRKENGPAIQAACAQFEAAARRNAVEVAVHVDLQQSCWMVGRTARGLRYFKTLADFRKENGPAIQAACAQFVVLCRRLNLFSKTGQPDQLYVALALAFEAAARRNAVEVAVHVDLQPQPSRPPARSSWCYAAG
jgi:hypothetical protein